MDVQDHREFLDCVEQAEPIALSVVVEHFRPILVKLADRQLPRRLRSRVDPEDGVQLTLWEFVLQVQGRKCHFSHVHDMRRLLIRIMCRTALDQIKEHCARCRDIDRDVSLQTLDSGEAATLKQVSDNDPFQLAAATDEWEHLWLGCSPRDRQIIEYRSQNYAISEIALLASCSERLVNQVLEVARLRLTERAGLSR